MTARWRTALAVGATALALGAAGCGGDDDGGGAKADGGASAAAEPSLVTAGPGVTGGGAEHEAIVALLDDYAHAVRAKDADAICTNMVSAELGALFEEAGVTCQQFLGDTIAKEAAGYELTVERIDVTDDRATVRARAPRDDSADQMLVKEDGRWRLTLPRAR